MTSTNPKANWSFLLFRVEWTKKNLYNTILYTTEYHRTIYLMSFFMHSWCIKSKLLTIWFNINEIWVRYNQISPFTSGTICSVSKFLSLFLWCLFSFDLKGRTKKKRNTKCYPWNKICVHTYQYVLYHWCTYNYYN